LCRVFNAGILQTIPDISSVFSLLAKSPLYDALSKQWHKVKLVSINSGSHKTSCTGSAGGSPAGLSAPSSAYGGLCVSESCLTVARIKNPFQWPAFSCLSPRLREVCGRAARAPSLNFMPLPFQGFHQMHTQFTGTRQSNTS
jgi:hypothetical protein